VGHDLLGAHVWHPERVDNILLPRG
jgi:hypothetical protein